MAATIVWFRQDLRLQDNPALAAAVARDLPVVPVYIQDEAGEDDWAPGAAARWWLHHSLAALDAALRERGSRLVIRRGASGAVLRELIQATGAIAVHWNRRYEPAVLARDTALQEQLGVAARSFNATLLFEPHAVRNKAGRPFQVFTPFWRHCLTQPVDAPVKLRPGPLKAPAAWPKSLRVDELALRPKIKWDKGLAETWQPGEAAALKRLKKFSGAMANYA